GLFGGRMAAINARTGAAGMLERDAAHGGFGLFLDFSLAVAAAAPPGEGASLLDGGLELRVIGRLGRMRLAKFQRAVIERLLDLVERLCDERRNSRLRDESLALLAGTIAAGGNHRAFGDVLWPEFETQRDAAHLPIVEFEPRAHAFALIHFHADAGVDELAAQRMGVLHHRGALLVG